LLFIAVCISFAFVSGYTMRMTGDWPRLHEFRRSQYAEVWDALSDTPTGAAKAAAGISEENALQVSGTHVAQRIAYALSIKNTDDVLEIGCGVGRVGWAMAPLSGSWTGCDISSGMLSQAHARLRRIPNIRLIHLKHSNLQEVPDASVDVVYCTNALPHFSQTERWQYVLEAHRILRPLGRLYIDSIALNSPDGWLMVMNNLEQSKNGVNPPYAPVPSTPDELLTYFSKAGFTSPRVEYHDSLIAVIGLK
jgi:ubiquinone/menaquinone biosynthesis C-methylase UbiE